MIVIMKKRVSIIILLIAVLVVILGYYLYPRTGTLNSFLSNNYNKENIEQIEIRSTYSGQDKTVKDKDEINKILDNVSNIKLVRHYGSTENKTKGAIHIFIYDESRIVTEIIIQGKEYIDIINDYDNSNKEYKIIDNSLDLDYINRLIS
jgi:cell division protein YceG involved in septum cleavage